MGLIVVFFLSLSPQLANLLDICQFGVVTYVRFRLRSKWLCRDGINYRTWTIGRTQYCVCTAMGTEFGKKGDDLLEVQYHVGVIGGPRSKTEC